jgi:orotate phosphoribosyltransferase
LSSYKARFIEFALGRNILKFGSFTLKSGRVSPYFYNGRLLCDGKALNHLADCYVDAIEAHNLQFDILFGPAYAAIPLVAAVSLRLAQRGRNVPFCFNRKEPKTYGEGGQMVGAPLAGKVLVLDDVITAGCAFRDAMKFIDEASKAELSGVLVQVNRQEKGQGERSAMDEIKDDFKVPVEAVITLDDIVAHIQDDAQYAQALTDIAAYKKAYGA